MNKKNDPLAELRYYISFDSRIYDFLLRTYYIYDPKRHRYDFSWKSICAIPSSYLTFRYTCLRKLYCQASCVSGPIILDEHSLHLPYVPKLVWSIHNATGQNVLEPFMFIVHAPGNSTPVIYFFAGLTLYTKNSCFLSYDYYQRAILIFVKPIC